MNHYQTVLNRNRGSIGLFAIVAIFIVIIVLGFFYYSLFLSSPPSVETNLPPSLESANTISKIEFEEILDVVNEEKFKSLESYGVLPSIGDVGRGNPFIDYRVRR